MADAEAQLGLYQAFSVEVRTLGEAQLEFATHVAKAATAQSMVELESLIDAAAQHGVLCIGAALAEGSPDARLRVQRLCADAQRFVMAATANECALGSEPKLPLATLDDRLRRCVADAARTTGREVTLLSDFGDVEADAGVVRKLGEIMMHAVRNAVDHGIEAAAVRRERGKPSRGTLILMATEAPGRLCVELSDDGAGVNIERLRQRIVERGLLDASGASAAAEAQLIDFAFAPGFTTASSVTELSGRGVGLDIVRSVARELGGSAYLRSAAGRGCRLVVELPGTRSAAQ
ncbi:MAG: hypothetical protein LC659_02925 [Myxococcales bacterium]|nr:hypothetical protein [Myxococcales bacterium]